MERLPEGGSRGLNFAEGSSLFRFGSSLFWTSGGC